MNDSHLKAGNRDEDTPAIGRALSKGKAKGKGNKNSKNNCERKDCIRWITKANVQWEKHAHTNMTRTRKAKGRDDLVHFLRQVAVTQVLKAHQNLLVKVRQGKRTDYLVQASRKEVAKREIHVIIGMWPSVHNSELRVNADSETSVHTNTQQHMLMQRKIQHQLQFTFHRMMNDRCNYEKFSRMTRPNTE